MEAVKRTMDKRRAKVNLVCSQHRIASAHTPSLLQLQATSLPLALVATAFPWSPDPGKKRIAGSYQQRCRDCAGHRPVLFPFQNQDQLHDMLRRCYSRHTATVAINDTGKAQEVRHDNTTLKRQHNKQRQIPQ